MDNAPSIVDVNEYTFRNAAGKFETVNLLTGESVIHEPSMVLTKNYRYTVQIGDIIADAYRTGKSLTQIAEMDDMPPVSVIYKWKHNHPDFAKKLVEARQDRGDWFFDKAISIVNPEECNPVPKEDVPFAKLQVDTLKWAAERLAPKEYGAKQDTGPANAGAVTIVINTGIDRTPVTIEAQSSVVSEVVADQDISLEEHPSSPEEQL